MVAAVAVTIMCTLKITITSDTKKLHEAGFTLSKIWDGQEGWVTLVDVYIQTRHQCKCEFCGEKDKEANNI